MKYPGFILLILFISIQLSAQDLIIDYAKIKLAYHLDWQPSPSDSSRRMQDNVLVFIGDSITTSMAENIYIRDSLIRNVEPSILWQDLSVIPGTFLRFITFSNYPTGKLKTVDYVWSDRYVYTEPAQVVQWQLHRDTLTINGVLCQKATTDLGSRDWIAWFAPGTGINSGPYKFHGLPGLIVKLKDTEEHYIFNLISAKESSEGIPMHYPTNSTMISTTKNAFLQTQNRFTQNPSHYIIEDMHGIISDDPRTQRQIIRSLARRNNHIELFVR